MPKFATVKITIAKIDGKTPKAAAAIAVNMVTSAKLLQIATGKLGTLGNAWTETFKHA